MSTATGHSHSSPSHLRLRASAGGLLAGAALVAATAWGAAAGASDRTTDAAQPEIVPWIWQAEWLDPAERAAGHAGLAAMASSFASWAGTPTPPAPTTDLVAGLLDPSVFTDSQMAAIALGLEAAWRPTWIPGS